MTEPNFILLYVASPEKSAGFYADLLGKKPIESSPTFAMFKLDNGLMLGLWGSAGVEPKATPVGGSELAFAVGGVAEVDRHHAVWAARGISIAQTPTQMDFGYTFVATDLDGHRLRVFTPAT